jgi:hypothetical protein
VDGQSIAILRDYRTYTHMSWVDLKKPSSGSELRALRHVQESTNCCRKLTMALHTVCCKVSRVQGV